MLLMLGRRLVGGEKSSLLSENVLYTRRILAERRLTGQISSMTPVIGRLSSALSWQVISGLFLNLRLLGQVGNHNRRVYTYA